MAHGTCPSIGIGGHATIGGLGPTSRMWGMALDHVLEVEVVLANSSIVRASPTENADVFFAVEGAAASFGIVTEFKVRTEPEPSSAVQYSYKFNLGNAASNAFRDWQSLISDPNLSRKFASSFAVSKGVAVISGTYFGTKEEFNAFQLDHRFSASTSSSVVEFADWLGLVAHWSEDLVLQLFANTPTWFYSKSLSFSPQTLIPASGIDDLFEYLTTQPSGALDWFAIFDLAGGAINDVPKNATAYAYRDSLYWLQSYAITLGPVSQTTVNFLDGINDVIGGSLPGAHFGAYPGYVDPRLPNGQLAYWGSNLPRLQQIKTSIDPTDVFHNPQSVRSHNRPGLGRDGAFSLELAYYSLSSFLGLF